MCSATATRRVLPDGSSVAGEASLATPSRLAGALLSALGWKLVFARPVPAKAVIVFYRHTSNRDFVWGLLAKWATGIGCSFMIKHTLFRGLLGTWLESIGGLPIDRRASNGTVERVAQEFAERSSFLLVVTPEGTRRHTPGWKSGFYRIALAARVPVGLAFIDYARRQIGVAEYVELTGSAERDWKRFADFYATRAGRRPRHQAPVVPRS